MRDYDGGCVVGDYFNVLQYLQFSSLFCDCFSYSALLFFLLRAIFFWARKKRENQIHASLLRAPTLVHNWDELDGSKKADRGG